MVNDDCVYVCKIQNYVKYDVFWLPSLISIEWVLFLFSTLYDCMSA